MNVELERWLDSINFDGRLALDGSVQRYGKKKNQWVWSLAKGDNTFVVAGDWSTGERVQFGSKTIEIRQAMREMRDEKELWARAAATSAQEKWETLDAKPTGRTYLERKGVVSYGLRFKGRLLFVPMRRGGELIGLQTIDPAGEKRFTKSCAKRGSSHRIHGKGGAILCEGYATGASIHMATGRPVVVAFDCGNLAHAAKWHDDITAVAADNDLTPGNPGLSAAEAVAKTLGDIPVAFPPPGMDFNDLHAAQSLGAVARFFA